MCLAPDVLSVEGIDLVPRLHILHSLLLLPVFVGLDALLVPLKLAFIASINFRFDHELDCAVDNL